MAVSIAGARQNRRRPARRKRSKSTRRLGRTRALKRRGCWPHALFPAPARQSLDASGSCLSFGRGKSSPAAIHRTRSEKSNRFEERGKNVRGLFPPSKGDSNSVQIEGAGSSHPP